MLERRRDLDLANKAFLAERCGEILAQDLDGNLALVRYTVAMPPAPISRST
jgi:hypothetical protein